MQDQLDRIEGEIKELRTEVKAYALTTAGHASDIAWLKRFFGLHLGSAISLVVAYFSRKQS